MGDRKIDDTVESMVRVITMADGVIITDEPALRASLALMLRMQQAHATRESLQSKANPKNRG